MFQVVQIPILPAIFVIIDVDACFYSQYTKKNISVSWVKHILNASCDASVIIDVTYRSYWSRRRVRIRGAMVSVEMEYGIGKRFLNIQANALWECMHVGSKTSTVHFDGW